MIEARGLTRYFSELLAVDKLDLNIPKGEIFGLLGPNGGGKTTSIRILCGLISPTSGEASVGGFDVQTQADSIRGIAGLAPEYPGFYERISAKANLEFYASMHLMSKSDAITAVLRRVGLLDRKDDLVATFSKGMKQRLSLARAILHSPQVLFLDEPTSGLDPSAAKKVRELISELAAEGVTVLLCTHNLHEAETLCHRIAIFRQRLLAMDTPVGLKKKTSNGYVRIRTAQDPTSIVAVLEQLPTVANVTANSHWLEAALSDVERDTPRVIETLTECNIPILEVWPVQPTLEDVYLRILEKSP